MMTTTRTHVRQISAKDYARLSLAVYPDAEHMQVPGWRRMRGHVGQGGFYGAVFKNDSTKQVVVAFRGTNDRADVRSDMRIGLTFPMIQFSEAVNLYADAVGKHAKSGLTVTGHSLGGALAALVSAAHGSGGVTFNAPGTKHLHRQSPLKMNHKDVIHFPATHDPVSVIGQGVGREVFIDLALPRIECSSRIPIVVLGCVLGQGSAYAMEQHSMARMLQAIAADRRGDRSPWDWK